MQLDWNSILLALISAGGGGIIGSYLLYRVKNRNVDTDQFKVLVDEYKKLREIDLENLKALQVRVLELEEKHQKNVLEIAKLRNQLVLFEGSHVDSPLATWLKDTDFKMIFLNDEYEKLFLLTRGLTAEDYIGHNDFDVWDELTAKQFVKHDTKVINTKKPTRFIEEVELNGTRFWLDVIKFPRKLNGKVIGISGMVIRKSPKPLYIDKDEYQFE